MSYPRLHAEYGKGEFLSGVWCPRRYDDKRHILLTYFPEFLVEKVLPYEVGEQYVPKRYQTFIYPAAAEKDKKGQQQQKEILEAVMSQLTVREFLHAMSIDSESILKCIFYSVSA